MAQNFGDPEIKADKISSPTGAATLDIGGRKIANAANGSSATDLVTYQQYGNVTDRLGPIAGQENVPDTFLRIEHKIDPNMFTGPTGTRCVIPIHDPVSLDGELTHPCVVYTPEKWNGYYYWMAVTPYKDSIDSYEDPNIVASNDGINWEVPTGLTNPLDDAPGGTKYNSDTHLVFGPNNVLYLFWRYLDTSGDSPAAEENMYVRTSTDGVNWTPKQLVHQTDQTVERLLSPSFEYYQGKWHMFAVSIVGTKRVVYKTSTSLAPGSWTTALDCTVTLPSGRYPWHLFVTRVADQWVGLLNDSSNAGNSGQDGDLILMTADIGNEATWNVAGRPCVPRADTGFTRQYRSCFVPKVVNGMWGFDLWHSVWNPKYIYRTALTNIDYRPQSYAQFGRLGLGGAPVTRPLRLYATAPEMEFVESDASDKTWHMGVNSSIFKVTETGVQDKLLLAPVNSAYGMRYNDTNTKSSGNYEAHLLNPTIVHSGTASYTGLYVNVTETSTGSGTKLLIRAGVNGTTKFSVGNDGLITATNRITGVTDPTSAQDAATKAYVDTTKTGYSLIAYMPNLSAPADLSLYYFGSRYDTSGNTTAGISRVYIPKSGTVKRADIFTNQTAGTSESSTVVFRLNNTTDTDLTAALAMNNSTASVSNSSLNISVSAGDYFEIKWLTPNWSTNPTNVRISVQLYIE